MSNGSSGRSVYHSVTFSVVISMIFLGFTLTVLPLLLHYLDPGHALHLRNLHGPWGTILRDLGLAILIAGLVGTGYEVFTRRAFLEDVENTLDEVVTRRYEELDKVRMSGLKTIHREKYYARVEERFRNAKRSIRILQTWSGEFHALGSSLKQAAERGCDIRILLLQPDSEPAKLRGADLGHGETNVRKFIENDLAILNTLHAGLNKRVRDNLEVKLYKTSPVVAIHGYDDTNIVGTYWYGRHSQEGPQYEVVGRSESGSDDPFLAEVVNEHFNALWEKATDHEWPQPDKLADDRSTESRPTSPNGQGSSEIHSEREQL